MKRYFAIATLFLLNNELVSIAALLIMTVMLVLQIFAAAPSHYFK